MLQHCWKRQHLGGEAAGWTRSIGRASRPGQRMWRFVQRIAPQRHHQFLNALQNTPGSWRAKFRVRAFTVLVAQEWEPYRWFPLPDIHRSRRPQQDPVSRTSLQGRSNRSPSELCVGRDTEMAAPAHGLAAKEFANIYVFHCTGLVPSVSP